MEKLPSVKPGAQAPAKPAAADATQETAFDVQGLSAGGKNLARTEDFTMNDNPDATNQTEAAGGGAAPPAGDVTQAMDSAGKAATKTGLPSSPAAKAIPPAAAAEKSPPSTQKAMLGEYKIIKKLGQGGMGAVFLGHQTSLERNVAIKVLSKDLAAKPIFVQKFLREARVMAKLDHPNILRCYDVKETPVYHLVMEFVEGGSIGDWLSKQGKFSIGDSLHVILASAHALQHAHELKLIHRDIKPDNILLTKKGVVKVADLGLAKATDDDLGLTKTGTGAGTPFYMAPEQARDVKHVDGRSDIYSLGCMLYVFLTGEMPFKGATLVEIIESKEKGKFAPARKFNADVPEKLDLMIDKMLASKPEHRYQTCAELILDLDSLGLAHDHLSFIAVTGPQTKTAPAPPPRKIAMPKGTSSPHSASTPAAKAPQASSNFWYASFTGSDGKAVTRKLTTEQLTTLIKSQSFSEETQVSRTMKGGYRSLGTYVEFAYLFKALLTKGKAEKKTEKFQKFYDQIEKDEKSRQRWRWLHNKFLGIGGFVGFILWLIVIAAVLGGLGYLGYMFLPDLLKRIGVG